MSEIARQAFNSPLERLLKGGYITQAGAAECQAAADRVAPPKRKLSGKLIPLGQFPEPIPEKDNPAALFRNGWLRKGGGAFLIAPSGVGKSVLTVQAAICWSLGQPFFGICPVRPLKIVVIQAEDDREEVAEFRNSVRHGLTTDFNFDDYDIRIALGMEDPATARVFFYKAVGKVGEAFVEELDILLETNPDVDLLIVNPFQSYFGGDCGRNADLSRFFRTQLDPVIKDADDLGRDRAGILFIHHTNKPPNDKDLRAEWGNDEFAQYIGAGGAEIVNWARAILSLMPSGVPGVFRYICGKRWQRLDWVGLDGKPCRQKLIRHAENGCIYWRDATEEDVKAVEEVYRKPSPNKPPVNEERFSAVSVVSYVDAHPGLSQKQYGDKISGEIGCSSTTVRRKFEEAAEKGFLSLETVNRCKCYSVTEAGKNEMLKAQF
ncbi:MAG: AAA family ATPase [Lentisphaerae bacterium]|nr:AAA family ATPase [Lentisphaerota bacterium]